MSWRCSSSHDDNANDQQTSTDNSVDCFRSSVGAQGALVAAAARSRPEENMTLSDEHRKFYEQSLEITKQEVDELDQQIAAELAKVKDRLTELQKAKKATLQMYAAACARLGVPNDLADTEDEAPNLG
jgi:transcription termination factor NusB